MSNSMVNSSAVNFVELSTSAKSQSFGIAGEKVTHTYKMCIPCVILLGILLVCQSCPLTEYGFSNLKK
jgi:hypothetical protein